MANPFEAIEDLIEEQVEEADKKGTAELYKQATDTCMKWMKESGYTPANIEYLNSYFIFGRGSNSVIHYDIKECPEWNFAIWWSIEGQNISSEEQNSHSEEKTNQRGSVATDYVVGEFFCEHKQNMDKFKPSRCEYCSTVRFDKSDFDKNEIDWLFKCYWMNIVEFIHKHPCRAFYRTYCGTDFNKEYVSGFKCLFKYIKFKLYKFNKHCWNKHFEKSETRFVKKYVLPFCDYDSEHKAELVEMGEGWSPKYEIQCKIPDTADKDETGCFGVFDENALIEEGLNEDKKVKTRWDKLIKRHEKISNIFHFFANRICDDCVNFYRECDFSQEEKEEESQDIETIGQEEE